MSKIAVNLKIDVTKIDKARLFQGQKGVYLDAVVWIDPDNENEYGDHGMITQAVTKEEREQNVRGNILGNCKVFWRDEQPAQAPIQAPAQAGQPATMNSFDDDIPF